MGDRPTGEPSSAQPLQLLIADDSEPFRAGLAALVASLDGMVVIGTATDGDAAIAMALDLQPDVVLMDLSMPGRNGIEATRAIAGPNTAPPSATDRTARTSSACRAPLTR